MAITKSIYFFTLIFMLSCTHVDDEHLSGSYTGTVSYQNIFTIDGEIHRVSEYSVTTEVELAGKIFKSGDCSGELHIGELTVEFFSEDCDCWCDCNPEVDC